MLNFVDRFLINQRDNITFSERKTSKPIIEKLKEAEIKRQMAQPLESRAFRKALNKVRKERAGKAKEANNAN